MNQEVNLGYLLYLSAGKPGESIETQLQDLERTFTNIAERLSMEEGSRFDCIELKLGPDLHGLREVKDRHLPYLTKEEADLIVNNAHRFSFLNSVKVITETKMETDVIFVRFVIDRKKIVFNLRYQRN